MYFDFGKPKRLQLISSGTPSMEVLKKEYQIAVIDDNPFGKTEALRSHNFQIAEFDDVKRIEQIAEYAIVVCDIRGVGAAFDSAMEGAHVLAEIRKRYPDKFLIAYSGAYSDMKYNDALRGVDVSLSKDSQTDIWVSSLEKGLAEVGDPFRRWLRFRNQLSSRGFDAYDLFKVEQKYIESIISKNEDVFTKIHISPEMKKLMVDFAKSLPVLIKVAASIHGASH